jgi:nucleotide-binding universal stress UspA family protein
MLTWPDGVNSELKRALLLYDGSPKADEALYLAAYVVNCWHAELAVVTIETDYTPASALGRAQDYLDAQGIEARYLLRPRPIVEAVPEAAKECASDLLIMGAFGFSPMRYMLLGSSVTVALNYVHLPILICR